MDILDKKICILGTGGCARDILCCLIDTIASTVNIADIACFMVKDADYTEQTIMGVAVIPESTFDPNLYHVVVGIGDPKIRKKVVKNLPTNTTYATIIHPSAIVSKYVTIGEGTVIAAGCIVTCNISIGKHTQLNVLTSITHDCVLGDYFTTAPSVNVSGNCTLGECVYLGTNAAIKQGISITNNVTIGMGSVVIKNIVEPGIYAGTPVGKIK